MGVGSTAIFMLMLRWSCEEEHPRKEYRSLPNADTLKALPPEPETWAVADPTALQTPQWSGPNPGSAQRAALPKASMREKIIQTSGSRMESQRPAQASSAIVSSSLSRHELGILPAQPYSQAHPP